MMVFRYAQQAWLNFMTAKLRSFLALLGILVGTAAVVALISCGQLATEKALAQFKALGTDLLSVGVYTQSTNGQPVSGRKDIPLAVWRQLPARIPAIRQIAPYSTGYQPLSFQGNKLTGSVIGADESLAHILHIALAHGYFVSFVASFERICVIGDGVAAQLRRHTLDSPIGKQLRVGPILYTIVGVAKPWKENGFFNDDINESIIIPIAGMALVSQDARVNNAILLLQPDTDINAVVRQIKQQLNATAPALSIFIRSAKQLIASMESQGKIFTLLLAVIGGISLLVGGIGVMNVMLVSVSERTREIGIRKAVGAKKRDIQLLFLVESVMLSLFGGVLGVLVGLLFTRGVAYVSGWPFAFYLTPPLAGFAVSVVTGIFFGFYPARRAAQLEPMVCLRAT